MRNTIVMIVFALLLMPVISCTEQQANSLEAVLDGAVPIVDAGTATSTILLQSPAADFFSPGLRMILWIATVILSGASGAYQDYRGKK